MSIDEFMMVILEMENEWWLYIYIYMSFWKVLEKCGLIQRRGYTHTRNFVALLPLSWLKNMSSMIRVIIFIFIEHFYLHQL